jgi:hypothetical protein
VTVTSPIRHFMRFPRLAWPQLSHARRASAIVS